MKISVQWLRDYISFDYSPEELAEHLTMVGLEVEDIIHAGLNFSGVVVGELVKVENHPSSKKLTLCTVNTGTDVLSIVCGAPNVAPGQIVPVARVGAVLSDGGAITSRSIRGVRSEGMICSERELGLSDNHDGILVLDASSYTVGEPFRPASDQNGVILNINVTPNRPDCLSHFGVAREIGVITGKPFTIPDISIQETSQSIDDWITIEIQDSDACPRYSARVVHDVTVGPSPDWLRNRLESVGIRSISNVVDVTNFVLMETGQPLHGFDYDLVQGKKIVVRKAAKDENFTTLDGMSRTLASDDLLICDGERPVALAGVMGGLNSEMTQHTKHILIESAYFDPMTIRRTAKRQGLSTEASQRFERGADPNGTIYAADRAAQLLSEIAGGKVVKGVSDAYPRPISPWKVTLRPERIRHVLDIEIPKKQVMVTLQGLGLSVEGEKPYSVTVPTFRPDLTREIDLIEELVRHYGYEKIPARLYQNVPFQFHPDEVQNFVERLRDIFVGAGFIETMTNSMVPPTHITAITPDVGAVTLENPVSPDTAVLRTSLWGNLLDSIRWNKNRSEENLRLFEIGRIFWARKKTLPDEKVSIAGALTGHIRQKPFWGESDTQVDFFHLKGVVETLAASLHVETVRYTSVDHHALEPETSSRIVFGQNAIGWMGEIRKSILAHWDISSAVYVFEIFVKELYDAAPRFRTYTPIPKFPAIKRDLAIVIDENVPVSTLEQTISETGGEILTSVELFDLYRGPQVPKGKKSAAFSLTFLSPDRTLKEEEIDPIISSIMKRLETSHKASLRS
jgi:phenylalanyl-tRNA synthetase beta chain